MDQATVLALRAKAGDRRSLEQFIELTAPDVRRMCQHLGRPSDPDDLMQETFERALKSMHRFRGEGSARSWVLSIARRVCVDATRRSMRKRRLADKVLADPSFSDAHVDASWVEIDELLDSLDDDRREAFVLTQLVGLSYESAAELVGCPIGTIRSRVARARRQLLGDATLGKAIG